MRFRSLFLRARPPILWSSLEPWQKWSFQLTLRVIDTDKRNGHLCSTNILNLWWASRLGMAEIHGKSSWRSFINISVRRPGSATAEYPTYTWQNLAGSMIWDGLEIIGPPRIAFGMHHYVSTCMYMHTLFWNFRLYFYMNPWTHELPTGFSREGKRIRALIASANLHMSHPPLKALDISPHLASWNS